MWICVFTDFEEKNNLTKEPSWSVKMYTDKMKHLRQSGTHRPGPQLPEKITKLAYAILLMYGMLNNMHPVKTQLDK